MDPAKQQDQPTEERYFVFEELYNANPLVLHRFVDLELVSALFRELHVDAQISRATIKYEGARNTIFFVESEFDHVSEEIVRLFITDLERANAINMRIVETARAFVRANAAHIAYLEAQQRTREELVQLWQTMERAYADLFRFTWIHNGLDFNNNLFTTRLFEKLEEHVRTLGHAVDLNAAFVLLTTPTHKDTSFARMERRLEQLRPLVRDPQMRTKPALLRDPVISEALANLTHAYNWLGFGFEGPAWDMEHFADLLLAPGRGTDDARIEEQRTTLLESLHMEDDLTALFELARNVLVGTELRKEAMFNYFFIMDALFAQLSPIVGISKNALRYVYPWEIQNHWDPAFPQILQERIALHLDVERAGASAILHGEKARDAFQRMHVRSSIEFDGKQLHGQTSFPGIVQGTVKIVNEKGDIPKVHPGDILVSIATNPELVSAMKLAAAFVTDRGGITCHAAILSRELQIPCIVGTRIATRVLHDGDVVEVDADHGIVRLLR